MKWLLNETNSGFIIEVSVSQFGRFNLYVISTVWICLKRIDRIYDNRLKFQERIWLTIYLLISLTKESLDKRSRLLEREGTDTWEQRGNFKKSQTSNGSHILQLIIIPSVLVRWGRRWRTRYRRVLWESRTLFGTQEWGPAETDMTGITNRIRVQNRSKVECLSVYGTYRFPEEGPSEGTTLTDSRGEDTRV